MEDIIQKRMQKEIILIINLSNFYKKYTLNIDL